MKSTNCQSPTENINVWQNCIMQSSLTAATRHVLLTLAVDMQSGEAVAPTIEAIAERTGQCGRTVERSIQKAREAGYLNVERRQVAAGRKQTINHYSAAVPFEAVDGPAQDDSDGLDRRNIVPFRPKPGTVISGNSADVGLIEKASNRHCAGVVRQGGNGLVLQGATTPARTCGKDLYIYKYYYKYILSLKQFTNTRKGYASTFGVGPGVWDKSNYNRVPPREAVATPILALPSPAPMLALPAPVQQPTAAEPSIPAQPTSRPSLPAPEHGVPEIAAMLGQHAASLIPQWYPEAQPLPPDNPRRYVMGSIHGERGRSFAIYVRDSGRHRAGRCYESNGGTPGDMLDLLEHVENLTRNQAIKRAREIIGIPQLGRDAAKAPVRRAVAAPPPPPAPETTGAKFCDKEPGIRPISADSTAGKWLIGTRKLTPETLAAYRIAECRDGEVAAFPAFHSAGDRPGSKSKPGTMKMRDIRAAQAAAYAEATGGEAPSRGNGTFTAKNGETGISWGRQAVPADTDVIVYSEGEIDAMSWFQQTGIPAISPLWGAGSKSWLGPERDWQDAELTELTTIYIAMDRDSAGQGALPGICRAFGLDRCYVVEVPNGKNDANQALQCGATESDFCRAIASATPASKLFAEQAGSAQ